MTSWTEMAAAVRTRMSTALPSVAVQYDNHALTPPDVAPWVRWTLQPAGVRQPEFGTYRTDGRAVASIFTPMAMGVQAGLALADTISAAFRLVAASGVTWRSPAVRTIGRAGKWWQLNVECPFYTEDQA